MHQRKVVSRVKDESSNERPRTAFLISLAAIATLILIIGWILRPTAGHEPTAPVAALQREPTVESATRVTPATVVKQKATTRPPVTLEEKWGVQVTSMRMTMADSAVDLRIKVLDPVKAASLADGKTKAYLVNEVSGKRIMMPTPPKEGAFPPTSNKLIAGKTYFALLGDPGKSLQRGSKVTLVIGDSRTTNLILE